MKPILERHSTNYGKAPAIYLWGGIVGIIIAASALVWILHYAGWI